jgi:hypothetical protein
MSIHGELVCAAAALLLSAPCRAEQWFAVERPGARAHALVEVDLDSIDARGSIEVIRVSFDTVQHHAAGFDYRSFVGNAQFDCRRRSVALASAAYYTWPAGKGDRAGTDSSGRDAGMPPNLISSIPVAAVQALLRATCARARPT